MNNLHCTTLTLKMSLLPFFYFHQLDSNLSIASKYYPKKIHLVNLVVEEAKANVMAKVVVEFKC